MSTERDPRLTELARWIRAHDEIWAPDDLAPLSATDIDSLVDDILTGRRAEGRARRASRRLRRRLFGGGLAIAVVAGGGLGAAALLRTEQPKEPQTGVACRATAQRDADAAVVGRGVDDDPLELCAAVWRAGRLGDSGGAVPPLAACIGLGGVVEVFPGDESVCETLGLSPAARELSDDARHLIELQDRMVEEINAATCRPTDDVVAQARHILDDMGFADWQIVVNDDAVTSTCANVALDVETTSLFILTVPQENQ